MNNYEQIIKQLVESTPSWEKDGGGIRGRTIAPILSGLSSNGGMAEFIPQQFNQNNNETIQRSAPDPIADLILDGGGGGGGGETPAHPWKITIRTVEDSDPPAYEYAIESASRLFDGFGGTEVTVVGADGVFRNLEEGYYFIEVDFSDGNINQAQIQIDENIGNLIEYSSGTQTKLRQQIGYVFFDDDGNPQLRQNAWHNYSLFDTCRNGIPAKVTLAT